MGTPFVAGSGFAWSWWHYHSSEGSTPQKQRVTLLKQNKKVQNRRKRCKNWSKRCKGGCCWTACRLIRLNQKLKQWNNFFFYLESCIRQNWSSKCIIQSDVSIHCTMRYTWVVDFTHMLASLWYYCGCTLTFALRVCDTQLSHDLVSVVLISCALILRVVQICRWAPVCICI